MRLLLISQRNKILTSNLCHKQVGKVWLKVLKPIKFQTPQIINVLMKLAKFSDDPKTRSEVNCLVTCEIENFEFL